MRIKYYEKGNKKLSLYGIENPCIRRNNKMADEKMVKVENKIFKFENEGDKLKGVLVSREKSSSYNNMVYKIQLENNEIFTVFGSVVLDDQLSTIKDNTLIEIVFMGTKKNNKPGQNPIKLYEVYYAE